MTERLSVFDIFKIGVGPSSSHTLGPWRAAQAFLSELNGNLGEVEKLRIDLYGSLAKTGRGHGTDLAVLMGLSGHDPVRVDTMRIDGYIRDIHRFGRLLLDSLHPVPFSAEDIVFHYMESLPAHPNAMRLTAWMKGGRSYMATYYSVGGGFIHREGDVSAAEKEVMLPYPVDTASDLARWCRDAGVSIAAIVRSNEHTWCTNEALDKGLDNIIAVMLNCVGNGCHNEGILPGGLGVARRAAALNKKLLNGLFYGDRDTWYSAIRESGRDFTRILDWVSCFALAVNEENASFGRVVTAPTNGAAGVVPAVLMYYRLFCNGDTDGSRRFLLAASEIGCVFKKGATISAAMGGCQAEIGVSSAMAAAGLTEVLGGTPQQVLMAAEIAMEHHLGMTCDPVGGLVQIPCIERNAMGAVKAITAAQLALHGDPMLARVSLDNVVRTMWETALDMNNKYKETAEGGLAAMVPVSVPEC